MTALGASRMSSVEGLNVMPRRAIRRPFRPFSSALRRWTASRGWNSFTWMTAFSNWKGQPELLAMARGARESVGKHEPP